MIGGTGCEQTWCPTMWIRLKLLNSALSRFIRLKGITPHHGCSSTSSVIMDVRSKSSRTILSFLSVVSLYRSSWRTSDRCVSYTDHSQRTRYSGTTIELDTNSCSMCWTVTIMRTFDRFHEMFRTFASYVVARQRPPALLRRRMIPRFRRFSSRTAFHNPEINDEAC